MPVTILKVVGIELTSIGRFEPAAPDEEVDRARGPGGQRYRKLVIDATAASPARSCSATRARSPPVRTAITRGCDVRGQLDPLRAGRWDQLKELSGDQPLLAGAPASSA